MAGLAVLAVAYVLSQFYRTFLAVLAPALTADIGASNAELSLASGAWFISFALMQFPVGVWLDRYGPRSTAAVLMALGMGGGAALFTFASAPWMIVAAMVLIGIGCAPVLMAALIIVARSYGAAHFAMFTSWLVGFGSAGNVLGAAPMATAAEAFGWRPSMMALGIVSVLMAAIVMAVVRDPPIPEGHAPSTDGFAGYRELLRIRALWIILPMIALNYTPAAGIRGLWAGPFLADVYEADTLLIGQITLYMALAMVAGSFLFGPLDKIFRTRKWVAVVGNSICLATVFYLALYPLAGIWQVTVALVVIGVSGGTFGLLMAHGRAFVPAHLTGRGVTLLNFFSIGAVGIMQFATGGVLSAATVPGDPAFGYSALFAFYGFVGLIALGLYLAGRDAPPERRPR
jgi:MFS family permease